MLESTAARLAANVGDWLPDALVGIAVGLAVLAAAWLVRCAARRRYGRLAQTAETELLEIPALILGRTTWAFMLVAAACGAVLAATPGARAESVAKTVLTIALFWQAGGWASIAVRVWLDQRRSPAAQAGDRATAGSIGVIRFLARCLIWGMVLLLTLDNLGVDITALVAGLGIGGIAVALAVQNVLGDLLASLSIALDQPFLVGDFVVVGEHMGTVEYVGIKSTRLRSLTGEQIVMSNADMLAARLRNYGRMQERRVVFAVGVTYETPRDRLEAVPDLLREAVERQDGVRFDRAHFARFGAYSLDFECVYYVLTPDYNRYMDLQQAINYRIHAQFLARGLQFAYPAQTLWLARAG